MSKKIIQLVLVAGMSLCATRAFAQSIHEAATVGDVATLHVFIESGADVNAVGGDGFTALQMAARRGHKEAVETLLAGGADVNLTHAGSGFTAADFAFQVECFQDKAELTSLLVSRGAEFDPNRAIRGPFTRLDLAVSAGNADMTRLLLSLGAAAVTDAGHPRPRLVNAAMSGNVEIIGLLLDAGVTVDQMDKSGNTALRFAVENGHVQAVAVLLERGADAEFVDETNGRNLLHIAALGGHDEIVTQLLNKGAPVDARDSNDRTPLYYAAKYGHRQLATILIEHGATRPNDLVENYGRSPHLTRDIADGEAVAWYLNNRGWTIRTSNNVLVFDAEEWGVTRPAEPSLANGFITSADLAGHNVVGLYTCYHGEIGEPAYLHAIEDSLSSVTYVQNAGDRWRGSERSVYLSPMQDTTAGDIRISTIPVTEEMTSLGYLVEVDGVAIYYAGFRAENLSKYKEALGRFDDRVERVDLAFVPLIEPDEDDSDYKALLEILNPRAVFVLDADRREEEYSRMRDKALSWGFEPQLFFAQNPGDVFVFNRH